MSPLGETGGLQGRGGGGGGGSQAGEGVQAAERCFKQGRGGSSRGGHKRVISKEKSDITNFNEFLGDRRTRGRGRRRHFEGERCVAGDKRCGGDKRSDRGIRSKKGKGNGREERRESIEGVGVRRGKRGQETTGCEVTGQPRTSSRVEISPSHKQLKI